MRNNLRIRNFNILLLIYFIAFTCCLNAQIYQQSIEGKVVDKVTFKTISQAKIILLLGGNGIDSLQTNENGNFKFDGIAVGKYDLIFDHPEYLPAVKIDVLLTSSRPKVIDVALQKRFELLEEVTIVPELDREEVLNDMSTQSAISIDAKTARKIAGGLDDPIRVAANFAGINSNGSFSDNFISVRGNSPRALKYYFDGLELPNPTHFARIGSSGGTFTIFSLRLLDDSDFFAGAFPAEYSNSVGGIFDVNFKKGNINNNEFAVEIGTLGIDVSSEGPINKSKKSSYTTNFRYATIGLARLIGYPTQPTYTDFAFNLNFPIDEKSNLKIYSINGISDRLREAEKDISLWEEGLDRYELSLNSKLFSIGSTYSRLMGENVLFKLAALTAFTNQQDNRIFLLHDLTEIPRNINEYTTIPISVAASLKKSYKNTLVKIGAATNFVKHQYNYYAVVDTTITQYPAIETTGNTLQTTAYVQAKTALSRSLSLNIGLNATHHNINNEVVAEPRIGLIFKAKQNRFSMAYGKHSQFYEYSVYNFEDEAGKHPNLNLKATKAHHFGLAYSTKILRQKINIEGFYQLLYDVPIEPDGTFSIINLSELNELRTLINEGKGKNYGIDFSIGKYITNNWYYNVNASYIKSLYTDGDDIWRSTEFDFNYNIKLLAGKDFEVGKRKNKKNNLSLNTTFTAIGGRPYTPVDLIASAKVQSTIYNENLAFSQREEGLLVLDFTVIYQTNKAKRSSFWTFQIKNLFSSADAVYREYDVVTKQEVIVPSSSFFPVISYGLEF